MFLGARVGKTLLPEVDINAVTGALKLYFRELPEALITDALYPNVIDAYSKCNQFLLPPIMLSPLISVICLRYPFLSGFIISFPV